MTDLVEHAEHTPRRAARPAHLDAVLQAAGSQGLLQDKTSRITGRVSPALVERARKVTGLTSDTALIEYALASLALEDGFADAFVKAHGTVDPDLDLGF